jgi:phospholipid N-methyltransferase
MNNLLLKSFIKDKHVGAIFPSSKLIVKKIIDKIDFQKAKIIVEYGPGKGVITKKLLDNMHDDASLFVFETNEQFINDLFQIKDRRLIIINTSAENARLVLKNRYKTERVDYIVSTIPFTFLDRRMRRRIIYRTFTLLNEKGRFITYQYSWLIFHLINRKFKKANWKFVLLNIPPAIIFEGIK